MILDRFPPQNGADQGTRHDRAMDGGPANQSRQRTGKVDAVSPREWQPWSEPRDGVSDVENIHHPGPSSGPTAQERRSWHGSCRIAREPDTAPGTLPGMSPRSARRLICTTKT